MKQNRVMLQMTQFHCEFSPFIGFVVLVYIGANPKIYFPRPNNIDIAWPILLITNDIPLWTLHNFKFIKIDTKMSSFWKKELSLDSDTILRINWSKTDYVYHVT